MIFRTIVILVTCNVPIVTGATESATVIQDGQSVSYTCNNGYVHTSGDLTRTCSGTTLGGTQPVCTCKCEIKIYTKQPADMIVFINSCSAAVCVFFLIHTFKSCELWRPWKCTVIYRIKTFVEYHCIDHYLHFVLLKLYLLIIILFSFLLS